MINIEYLACLQNFHLENEEEVTDGELVFIMIGPTYYTHRV